MDKSTPTLIKVDYSKRPWEMPGNQFHNRFHPEIPSVVQVQQGDVFKVECYDAFGGLILNTDNLLDAPTWDINQAHYLSGPISVDGAEPGDLLEVELLDIEPHSDMPWGFTCIFPPPNGGFLADIFTNTSKCIWDFEGVYAKSRHIPGVRFPGIMHPGVVATAPSKELLDEFNRRESELVRNNPQRVPLALLPEPRGALMGLLELNEVECERIKKEAVRTVPPRENGGNMDIKNLHKGTKIWLPVHVHGANLSVGDAHFAQGDGEMALCGAIETAAVLTLRTSVIKNGMSLYGINRMPMYVSGPVEPNFTKYLTFKGINVDDNGQQGSIDPRLSYRQAAISAIEYLQKFGYTKEQAYIILSACPIEARIASIVNLPNALVTMGVPTDAFEFNIEPNEHGPVLEVRGSHPPSVI